MTLSSSTEFQIDLQEVFHVDRHEYRLLKNRGGCAHFANGFRKLFFVQLNLPKRNKANYLFFRSLVRNDYKRMFSSIHRAVDSKQKIVIEDYVVESYFGIFAGFVSFISNLRKISKIEANKTDEKLYLYLRLCFYERVLKSIKRYEFKHLVLFADMQPVENYLSQYFNQSKTTITLQHGLYVEYETLNTINKINYSCQPSKNFLAWGENTKELILKYHPEREVIICGKPHIYGVDISKINSTTDSNIITVILDQNIFEQENRDLLLIAHKVAGMLNMKINVRFHPYNRKSKYRKMGIEFLEHEELESSRYVIGHTSSLLYELYAAGMRVFKYKTNIPCVKFPEELCFDTVNSLKTIIENNSRYQNRGQYYICCFGAESIKKYEKYFESLK